MKKICRVFFSRYAISAFLIVLQVLFVALLFVGAAVARYHIWAFAILFSLVAFFGLVNRDTNPEYKIPWSFIILALPPVGAILYFCFYQRKLSRQEISRLRRSVAGMRRNTLGSDGTESLYSESPKAAGMARAILNDDPFAEVYSSTKSRFFESGEKFFDAFVEDISSAKEYIFLEYFIIDEGELWSRVHDILKRKAAEGVDVRLLYDDVGCMKTLPSYYERTLRKEGIRAYRFSRVSARVSSIHNNRDHRKICVVDGRCGYTGGVNIADEYINRIVRFGYWKDGGIRLEGDSVKGLIKLFLSAWELTTGEFSDADRQLLNKVMPALPSDGGYYLVYGSGPAPIYPRSNGKNVFLNLINQAERYVYITTPYLIIDYDLTEALRSAAMRGIDVRIITPGVPDKKRIKIMTKSSYPYLIEAGVKIYEYTPGFIHEKTLVSDDEYAVVGTINLDYRSLVHHFEDAVWMYGGPTVDVAKSEMMKTLSDSERISFERTKLTFTEWIFKMGMRIFAPLL